MTVGFQSVWQKCKCPIYASQDGVCGCPQFWKRKDIPSAPPTKTTTSAQNNIDAQPGATHKSRPGLNDKDGKGVETSCETSKCVGPPQETCFFWYHGTCHRGSDCNFAHESHITWPITAPPKFVHFEPCNLPLCPLRQDLAVLMEDPRRGRSVWRSRFDGQLDGAAASFLGRETSNEATSSDIDSANTGNKELDENMDLGAAPIQSLIDPSSRPLDGSYSDSNSDLSEIGKSEEGDHTEQQDRNDVASSTPQIDDMDYFDLSGCKPLPPSSDIGEQVILSLSHPGTLGKRNCGSVSSPDREESECKRAKVEGKQGMLHQVSLPHNNATAHTEQNQRTRHVNQKNSLETQPASRLSTPLMLWMSLITTQITLHSRRGLYTTFLQSPSHPHQTFCSLTCSNPRLHDHTVVSRLAREHLVAARRCASTGTTKAIAIQRCAETVN